jgi:hypothetical protein
VNEHLCG